MSSLSESLHLTRLWSSCGVLWSYRSPGGERRDSQERNTGLVGHRAEGAIPREALQGSKGPWTQNKLFHRDHGGSGGTITINHCLNHQGV